MASRKPKFPPIVEYPLAVAMRLALTPIAVGGFEPSMRAARALGSLLARFDRRHFQRAARNIRDAYPRWTDEQVRRCAVGCHQHLMQLVVEFAHAPRLVTRDATADHLFFTQIDKAVRALLADRPVIMITGHVGNWELIGYAMAMLGFPLHAVYRPLDLRPLDTWVKAGRERRGLMLLNKFGATRSVPAILAPGRPVGLVADQSGGERGVFTPFFGRLTSTYKMIGILALQKQASIICGHARRLLPGEPPPPGVWQTTYVAHNQARAASAPKESLRFAVEAVDTFGPEDWADQQDPLFYITARYRRALELMVRTAPDQYFWMHRLWRARPAHERQGRPFPPQLREKLAALPWLTPADVDAVVERSNRDAADYAALIA